MEFTGERFLPTLTDAVISYEHWHRYLYAGSFVKGKVVLDIASGEGYGSHLLAESGAEKVIGIDVDPQAVRHATVKYAKSNLTYVNGSIAAIPVESASVDVLISFETIEHVAESLQVAFLAEILRVLKPDGILIISTPNKKTYSDIPQYANEFHVKEFYVEEFLDFLRQSFRYIELLGQKIFTTSYIWPETERGRDFREYAIEGTDNGFAVLPKSEKEMLYAVVVCSNDRPIQTWASLLVDKDDLLMTRQNQLIWGKNGELAEKDRQILEKTSELAEKDRDLTLKEQQHGALLKNLEDKELQIAHLEQQLCQKSLRYQLKQMVTFCMNIARKIGDIFRKTGGKS